MKRCPECRRDYYDDTLLYCLDDGNALLEGPASGGSSADETATAIVQKRRAAISSAVEKVQISVVGLWSVPQMMKNISRREMLSGIAGMVVERTAV